MHVSTLLVCVAAGMLAAQDEPAAKLAKRFGYQHEPVLYPQKSPQETLQSVLKAIDGKKIEYLLAHLSDPAFIDRQIDAYKALYKGSDQAKAILAFERLARETGRHFLEDPALVKELRQFAKDADWETKDDAAVGTLKTGSPRRVYLRKLEERWFLENRQQ
jgi:hypothetical protein